MLENKHFQLLSNSHPRPNLEEQEVKPAPKFFQKELSQGSEILQLQEY
jgi:hypothetical protein